MKNIKKIPPDSAVLSGVEGSTKNQQHKQSDNEKQQNRVHVKKRNRNFLFLHIQKETVHAPRLGI